MEDLYKVLIGIVFLAFGFPIGDFLKKKTKDEQKDGRKWFKLLVLSGLIGGFIGLLIGKDWVLFTFFFIAIVSSRSLIKTKPLKKKKRKSP